MAIGLQNWVADGREGWDYGPQPLPLCTITGLTQSALVIPVHEFDGPKAPANANQQTPLKRRKSKLSWPEKFIAYQIGFTLESLIAALEKFVG